MSVAIAVTVLFAIGCRRAEKAAKTEDAKQRGREESLAVDISGLKSEDGQPLIVADDSPLTPPQRPADPEALPLEDPLHWYDIEYAGWKCEKAKQPESPNDGCKGKKVVFLKFVDHPYHNAYFNGMKKVADAYGIQVKTMVANTDINIQAQQVDQAINERPDMVIIQPVDAKAVVPLLRKLNQAGVPVIASNLIPTDQGMPYILTWTGPDDWGQFRMLAHEFARLMNNEGGYCIVRHLEGTSPYYSRTFAMMTELKKIAPNMKMLDMQPCGLKAEAASTLVSGWISRFKGELKGIVSADDSGAQIGINDAIKAHNREDIIRVAAGNSKVGMDFVKAGTLHAITYQSAESDGALPMKLAADWFMGKPITKSVHYLRKHIITKKDVDQFMPAQW